MFFVDCINQSCNNGNIRVERKEVIQSLTYIKHINTQLGTSNQLFQTNRYSRSLPENATT